jgi:hypothetical protein
VNLKKIITLMHKLMTLLKVSACLCIKKKHTYCACERFEENLVKNEFFDKKITTARNE